MWWILIVILQVILFGSGIREEQRVGLWSWSKFLFALRFAALECGILIAPCYYIHDVYNRYFWPAYIASWIIAALNFIWMIIVARRWRLPDGRRSLQAYRDQQR
jgi:hypothetical protein